MLLYAGFTQRACADAARLSLFGCRPANRSQQATEPHTEEATMNLRTPLAAAALALIAVASQAQTTTPDVDARQARQEQRIAQGAASGALTKHETHKLVREQRHIAQAEQHAKADGVVTAKERARLHHMQDRASRDIAVQKHDAQTARR
jgi:hypothetical protein